MEPGDKIKVFYGDKFFEGILMPKDRKGYLDLKLSSGYNVGFEEKKVKKTELLEKKKNPVKKPSKISIDKNKKTILLLHTGGTIASKVDYSTGAVIAKFSESEILEMFPEIAIKANVKSKLVRNMQSEMMRFDHYNILAKAIAKEASSVNGIILTHGTDTLHYTSAALAFALQGIGIPVILVGSQRSSDRGSTDSAFNLMAAVDFITKTDFAGVAVCMHKDTNDGLCYILPACKNRKMHTSRRDAFRPVNTIPIADVNLEIGKINFYQDYTKTHKSKPDLKLFNEKLKIGLLKAHVHMYAEEVKAYEKFDGLVVELLGIGHMPTMKVDEFTSENEKILLAITNLAKKIPVVVSPQTIYGRVDMNVYTPGRQLIKAGLIGNYSDMTPETAFIKLAWLLSNYKNKDEIKELFSKNLVGEITTRTKKETFLS